MIRLPPTEIADAVTDVALAAERVVADRVELMRFEARRDARAFAIAAAWGGAALALLSVAVLGGAATVTWVLAGWLGVTAGLAVTTALALTAAGVLGVLTFRHLPGNT